MRGWILGLVWLWSWSAGAQVIMAPPPQRSLAERHRAPVPPARAVPRLNALLTDPVPPAAGTLSISGTVTVPVGVAMQGVAIAAKVEYALVLSDVTLTRKCADCFGTNAITCGCGDSVAALLAILDSRGKEAPLSARVAIGADGGFTLGGLAAGEYRVWVDVPGLAPQVRRVRLDKYGGLDDRRDLHSIALAATAGVQLTGVVVDESSAPVAGAVVTRIDREFRWFDAVTDAQGRFSLPAADPHDSAWVIVRRDGYQPLHRELSDLAQPKELRLTDPRRLTGMVLDGDRPAPGAEVTMKGLRCRATVKADAQGRFAFESLSPDSVELQTHVGDLWAVHQRVSVAQDKDEVGPVEVHVKPMALAEGHLTDRAGKPVRGATIELRKQGEAIAWTHTDAQGAFSVGPVEAGVYLLQGAGYPAPLTLPHELTLAAGKPTPFDLHVPEGEVISGKVTGLPRDAQNAELCLEEEPHHCARVEDGAFRLETVAPGPHSLRLHAEGWDDALQKVVAPQTGVKVAARRLGRVTGQVDLKAIHATEARVEIDGGSVFNNVSEQVDARGRFSVPLHTGSYPVKVVASTPAGQRTAAATAVIRAGQDAAVRLVFPPAATFEGVLRDDSGVPIAGAAVRAFADKGDFAQATTDAQGRFVLGPVARDSYRLTSFPDDAVEVIEQTVPWPKQPVALVGLRPEQQGVRGRAVGPDGKPLAHFTVNGREIDAADGAFVVTPLEQRRSSEYGALSLTAPGLGPVHCSLDMKRSTLQLGDVTFHPTRLIRGVVRDEAGKPARARLFVSHIEADPGRTHCDSTSAAVESGADGRFELTVPVLPLKLEVRRQGAAALELPVPDTGELDVRLVAAHAFRGRLRTADGKPLVGAKVSAGPEVVRTNAEGLFTLEGQPAGLQHIYVVPLTTRSGAELAADFQPGVVAELTWTPPKP